MFSALLHGLRSWIPLLMGHLISHWLYFCIDDRALLRPFNPQPSLLLRITGNAVTIMLNVNCSCLIQVSGILSLGSVSCVGGFSVK